MMKLHHFFNIPNILCYIRILLIPFFIIIYIHATGTKDFMIAALLIALSGITDFADGFIARNFNMITEIGKILDPLADKLTQAAIVFCLMFRFEEMIFVTIIFIIKEVFMGVSSMILLKRGKKIDGAKWFGKVSTTVFYFVMIVLIGLPTLPLIYANALLGIAGGFLLLSFFLYIPVFITLFHKSNMERKNESIS